MKHTLMIKQVLDAILPFLPQNQAVTEQGKTCYNSGMDKSDVRAYVKRWEAVAKIERNELQAASPAEKWRQLNAIKRRAARLGITRGNDAGEMEIFSLWARLKADYASN